MFENFGGFFVSNCWIKITTYLIFRSKHHKAQLVNRHQKFLKTGFIIQGFWKSDQINIV